MLRLAAIAVSLLLAGCSVRQGDFTMIATRNLDLSRMGEYKRGQRIEGNDLAHIILFIPTKLQPNIEDAIEDAIDKVPGAVALTDVVVRTYGWWFLYGQSGWTAEGTVLIDPELARQVSR